MGHTKNLLFIFVRPTNNKWVWLGQEWLYRAHKTNVNNKWVWLGQEWLYTAHKTNFNNKWVWLGQEWLYESNA